MNEEEMELKSTENVNETADVEASQNDIIADEIARETGTERFVIDDDQKADWAVKKIAEAKAEIDRWKQHYADCLGKITRQQTDRIDYLQYLLRVYFEGVPHKTSKTQESYALPSGKLIMRQPAPKYEVQDEALVPWLEANGLSDYVRTKKEAAWGELKKTVTVSGCAVVTEDGEVVPGVTVIPQEPEFKVS